MALKTNIEAQSDVDALLNEAWDTSQKNAVARGYMAGMIDTLRWSGQINDDQHVAAYAKFVEGGGWSVERLV